MDGNESGTVRLVRIDGACVPGEEAKFTSPDLTDFREGHYPGQWIGGMIKRGRVDEVIVSPDRLGRVSSSAEASGRLVFRAWGWDFEKNAGELRERVAVALREEMERFCDRLQDSIEMLPKAAAGPGPK